MIQDENDELQGQLKRLLTEFANNTPILGAAILSVEGLPLVSNFQAGTEEVAVAAMVAGIHSASEQAVQELRQGNLKSIIIEGDQGTIVIISIRGGYLLAITSPENVRLGLVFNDGKRVARNAAKILLNIG